MTLEAGKLYKKVGDTFVEVNTEEYVAPALTDALEINNTTPNTIAGNFVSNLESNSLKVSNNVGTGPKVEILKEGAVGLRVNDGTQDVLRAYVGASGDFDMGDVVIGELTGPNDTINKGLMWDDSTGKMILRGDIYAENGEFSGAIRQANFLDFVTTYPPSIPSLPSTLVTPVWGPDPLTTSPEELAEILETTHNWKPLFKGGLFVSFGSYYKAPSTSTLLSYELFKLSRAPMTGTFRYIIYAIKTSGPFARYSFGSAGTTDISSGTVLGDAGGNLQPISYQYVTNGIGSWDASITNMFVEILSGSSTTSCYFLVFLGIQEDCGALLGMSFVSSTRSMVP